MRVRTVTCSLTGDLSAYPAPAIEAAAACVVEIGMPNCVAPKMAVTAPTLEAKPELQVRLVMPTPIVSMMPQPPYTVPAAMMTLEQRMTHSGTSYLLQGGWRVTWQCSGRTGLAVTGSLKVGLTPQVL